LASQTLGSSNEFVDASNLGRKLVLLDRSICKIIALALWTCAASTVAAAGPKPAECDDCDVWEWNDAGSKRTQQDLDLDANDCINRRDSASKDHPISYSGCMTGKGWKKFRGEKIGDEPHTLIPAPHLRRGE